MAKTAVPTKSLVAVLQYCVENNCGVRMPQNVYQHKLIEKLEYTWNADPYRRSKIDSRVILTGEKQGFLTKSEVFVPYSNPHKTGSGYTEWRFDVTDAGRAALETHKGLLEDDGRLLVIKPDRYSRDKVRVGALCRVIAASPSRYTVEVLDLGDFGSRYAANIQGHEPKLFIDAKHVFAIGVTQEQYRRYRQAYVVHDAGNSAVLATRDADAEIVELRRQLDDIKAKLEEAEKKYNNRLVQRPAQLEDEIRGIFGDTLVAPTPTDA